MLTRAQQLLRWATTTDMGQKVAEPLCPFCGGSWVLI